METLLVTSSWKAARVNAWNDGQRKGAVNVIDQTCMRKFFTPCFLMVKKKKGRLVLYFPSLTHWMHRALHQPASQQKPLYEPPFMRLSGFFSALAMQSALYSYTAEANLYSVTQNCDVSRPTKLALTVSSNGRGRGGGPKPKCFLIGPLGDRAKVQHLLSKDAVKHETFTMATSVSAKHVL